ncbi:hypothetical protein FMJ25_02980 [Klebsiella grimontii]|nr:hypothetical protein [Klebsiella sp. CVUAS 5466.2]MBZ6570426.1 hypothetical protein [Klebsiella grimontii]PLL55226.1 hypothetical protein CWN04_22775 [Klebsiella michiganensis]MBZ6753902.1 hypothetical protein [Klebsiella grimontii]MBZ7271181.1 hypothetical protein [Klebsiella grimontii]
MRGGVFSRRRRLTRLSGLRVHRRLRAGSPGKAPAPRPGKGRLTAYPATRLRCAHRLSPAAGRCG